MTEPAEFLIAVGTGATALCPAHAQAFVNIMLAADQTPSIYAVDPDEPRMLCQACDLSDRSRPRLIVPH